MWTFNIHLNTHTHTHTHTHTLSSEVYQVCSAVILDRKVLIKTVKYPALSTYNAYKRFTP